MGSGAWGEPPGASGEDELPGARALTLKDVDWGARAAAGGWQPATGEGGSMRSGTALAP
jgi:hypothetical protein